jgi:hypothetical protein
MPLVAMCVFCRRSSARFAALGDFSREATPTYRRRYPNRIQIERLSPSNQNEVQSAFLRTTDCRRFLQRERWHHGHLFGDEWQMIKVRGRNRSDLSAFTGVTTVYAAARNRGAGIQRPIISKSWWRHCGSPYRQVRHLLDKHRNETWGLRLPQRRDRFGLHPARGLHDPSCAAARPFVTHSETTKTEGIQ